MKRAVSVGDTCIDYYDNLDRWYPTGNCVDFAVNLSDLGCDTAIVAMAGSDLYGKSVLELLYKHKVDTSHFCFTGGNTPMTHMTLGGESGRDRIHGSFDEGVMKYFTLTEDDLSFISEFEFVHTHKYGRIDQWLPEIRKRGCQIVYDFSTSWCVDAHTDIERQVDYGVYSCKEDNDAIRKYLKEAVMEYGMRAAIATLGDKGSIACTLSQGVVHGSIVETEAKPETDQEIIYIYQPAELVPDEKLINTVGAGDSYIAGLVSGLLKEYSLECCMAEGAKISARIVQVFEPYLEPAAIDA